MRKRTKKYLSGAVLLAAYGVWVYACLHKMTNPTMGGLVNTVALAAGMMWNSKFG